MSDAIADLNTRCDNLRDSINDLSDKVDKTGIFKVGGVKDALDDLTQRCNNLSDRIDDLKAKVDSGGGGGGNDNAIDALGGEVKDVMQGTAAIVRTLGIGKDYQSATTKDNRKDLLKALGLDATATGAAGDTGAGGVTGTTQAGPGLPGSPLAGLPSAGKYVDAGKPDAAIHGMWQELYNGAHSGMGSSTNARRDVLSIKYIDTTGVKES